jgi:hypothetical protein
MVTFTNGNSIASPTLNIDGAGAYPIRLGNTAASVTTFAISGSIQIPMWFSGAAFQLYGSHRLTDTDTTYAAMTTAEVDTGTSTTVRGITALVVTYIIGKVKAIFAQGTAPTDTNKLWYDTSVNPTYVGGDAVTVNGYSANATPTPNAIPVLGSTGKLPAAAMPLVMKSNKNTNIISLGNAANDFTGQSVVIDVAPGTTATAFVTISAGVNSASDFEFLMNVLVNGSPTSLVMTPAASLGSGRAHVRTLSGVLTLSSGTNTIVGRVTLAASTTPQIIVGGYNIAVIAMGSVS